MELVSITITFQSMKLDDIVKEWRETKKMGPGTEPRCTLILKGQGVIRSQHKRKLASKLRGKPEECGT